MNVNIARHYLSALEYELPMLKIVRDGVGATSGRPKFHFSDKSLFRLVKSLAEETNYDNRIPHYGWSKRQELLSAFNGYGVNSQEEARDLLNSFVSTTRKVLDFEAFDPII